MYQIFTFSPIGHPTTIVNTKFEIKESAEQKMNELKKVYDVPMMIKEIRGGK